jgi:isopenicillin N synthase-like dioxygenase
MGDRVPTLRLSDAASEGDETRRHFAGALRDALQDFGFACLTDHGVAPDLITEVYAAAEQFFGQSEANKEIAGAGPGGARGHTAFGVEHARDSQHADLKEFFHIGRDSNRWPPGIPKLATVGPALFTALEACAARVLESLALAYGLSATVFSEMTRGGNHVLRVLHYPRVPAGCDPRSIRAAPHEDINLVTLLCEASEPGLEILRPDGSWLAVEAPRGQIVIDAGDMLARLTNGAIPATTHRVINPPTLADRSRYSLPFFAHPRPECDLSVLPNFVSAARPARTAPITAGEFLDERLREIGLSP